MEQDVYEIHAIKYARLMRRSPENFIGGDAHDTEMPLNYYVWVISNTQRRIVVDTGFSEAMAKKRNRQIVRPVAEGVTALGLEPGKVSDVIITHMHYDHAGNIPLFANARYHLQDQEMEFATGRCMCHGMMRHGYEPDDISHLVRCVFDQRVQFHDGAGEVAPGIELHHIGGHTKGMQAVRVRTRRGWVVLASDAATSMRTWSRIVHFRFCITWATCWRATTRCAGWRLRASNHSRARSAGNGALPPREPAWKTGSCGSTPTRRSSCALLADALSS